MEQLQYDPRTKQQLKDALYDFLYTPVQNQFKLRLDTIIIRNTLLAGNGHKSFHYKGVHYSCDNEPNPRAWYRLLPQLRPQMDEYLRDLKELHEREMPFVVGYINKVLNASNEFGDYLQLLPESTHHPIEKLIATCHCHGQKLSPEQVQELRQQHQNCIDMMKARMVTNLLI